MATKKAIAKGKADSVKSLKSGTKAAAKGVKSAKGAKGDSGEKKNKRSKRSGQEKRENPSEPKRKLGLRGAAPWAARHAAKHAAEARARAAEPPLPGSARATIRTPVAAEDIKQRIGDLHNALQKIKGFRKNLNKGFFDVGVVLRDIQAKRLYEAKGFGTFEAFLERETAELGKTTALRLVRIAGLFQKDGALELGMDRIFMALMSIETGDGIVDSRPSGKVPPPPLSSSVLPLKPPGR
ncbi:MAG: hypothetical protein FWD73_00820 [Polyangiaceae bacterium]|nr:hypothetical protein [Polyangiaceae bacterium]